MADAQRGSCEPGARHRKADNGPAVLSSEDHRQGRGKPLLGSWKVDLDALGAQKLHADASMLPAWPVAPEQRRRAKLQGMQQETHTARVLRLVPMPLTLFTQGAGTAVRDPGFKDQTQAAASLWSPFTTPEAPGPPGSAGSHQVGGKSPCL